MVRSLIIDDEADAREVLRLALQKYCPEVEVLASCATPEEGLEAIRSYQPDLVFLDVQMPHMSGFDLLGQLEEINFDVVLVTAYDRYAIKAIKFSALDYLLKPVDVDDLVSAVRKARQKEHTEARYKSMLANMKNSTGSFSRLAIPTENEIVFQKLEDIIFCEADGSYTILHSADDKKQTVSKNLKEFESILPETEFCRIHHSTLVNLSHVVKYIKGEGGYVVMTGGTHLDVSRRKKEYFLQMLHKV